MKQNVLPNIVMSARTQDSFLVQEFAIEIGVDIVGSASVYIFHTKTRIYAEIHDVKVQPEYQNQGLGSVLVKRVLTQCAVIANTYQQNVYVRLTSGPHRKAANHLYTKLGFTLIADATDGGTNLYQYMCYPENAMQ